MKHKYINEVEFEKGVLHIARMIHDIFKNCGEIEQVLIDYKKGTITVVKDEYDEEDLNETEREI